MINQLIKSKRATFTPGSPYVPANAGQPYLPARTVYTTEQICMNVPTYHLPPGTTLKFVPFAGGNQEAGMYNTNWAYAVVEVATGRVLWNVGYKVTYTYQCQTVKNVAAYVPAQPYIPPSAAVDAVAPRTDIDFNLGWNSGARSIVAIEGDCRIKFKAFASSIGVVAGLSGSNPDAGYTSIQYGWYMSNGVARIIENGVTKKYVGVFLHSDNFTVERIFGEVRYLHNDVPVYTSLTPSAGVLFMDVSMYAGDDSIYDPTFLMCGSSTVSLEPLASAGQGVAYAAGSGAYASLEALTSVGGISATMVGQGANVTLRPMTASARGRGQLHQGVSATRMRPMTVRSYPASRSSGQLRPLVSQGSNKVYGASRSSLEALTTFATAGMLTPSYAISHSAMLYVTGGATGLTGEIGGSNAATVPLDSLSSGDDSLLTLKSYGESVVSMAPMANYASAYEGNTDATMWTMFGGFATVAPYAELLVVMNERMEVATVLAVSVLADAALPTELQVTDTYEIQALLNAAMRTTVLAGFGVPVFDQASQVWALNTATQASSMYEGYDFNSFGLLGGHYYGCKGDGLYRLEGADDAGTPIRASINFGLKDFGKSELKGITNAYIGVASDGAMVLKVSANGDDYFYSARANDTHRKTQRFDVGKGLRANYFELELLNTDGCDFDLSSIEFAAVTLSRRI